MSWIKFPMPDDPLSPQEQLVQTAHQGNRCVHCKGPFTQRDSMRIHRGDGLMCNKCIREFERSVADMMSEDIMSVDM